MEKKKELIKIPYRQDGEDKEYHVEIDFISNRVRREFSDLAKNVNEINEKLNQLNDIAEEIIGVQKLRAEGWEIKLRDLNNDLKELSNEINTFNDKEFFEKRYNMLKRIMQDNKVKDEFILSYEFWDEMVDPGEIMLILSKLLYKDLGKKKALGGL
jgi:hypothetical protein